MRWAQSTRQPFRKLATWRGDTLDVQLTPARSTSRSRLFDGFQGPGWQPQLSFGRSTAMPSGRRQPGSRPDTGRLDGRSVGHTQRVRPSIAVSIVAIIVAVTLSACIPVLMQEAVDERRRVADEQEELIEVTVTECGLETVSGTITNRNSEATRVSAVIWVMHGGGLLLTAAAHAAPIGPGETQHWTADTTGGDPVLSPEQIDALECRVESVVTFPL